MESSSSNLRGAFASVSYFLILGPTLAVHKGDSTATLVDDQSQEIGNTRFGAPMVFR